MTNPPPLPARHLQPTPASTHSAHSLPPALDSTPPPALTPASRLLTPAYTPARANTPVTADSTRPAGVPPPEPDSYIRDPHKLIAYIVPFPAPVLRKADVPPPPTRFLIYTPPAPPLLKPAEGEKERSGHKVQRKWQEEVREAHESTAKVMSWHGIKARVTKGVSWGVDHVTSADLDFLTRVPKEGAKYRGSAPPSGTATPGPAAAQAGTLARPGAATPDAPTEPPAYAQAVSAPVNPEVEAKEAAQAAANAAAAGDSKIPLTDSKIPPTDSQTAPPLPPRHSVDSSRHSADSSRTSAELAQATSELKLDDEHPRPGDSALQNATVKLHEMVLIYPPEMGLSEEQLREEFVNSLMRTKSKAQRDAVIATGLLPVTAALDWALMFVGWVFGGAVEIDAVWAAASYKGAHTARAVTKRIASSGDEALKLVFRPSERAAVLAEYLHDKCVAEDHDRFKAHSHGPSAHRVLDVIGWETSGRWENQSWEDERWERKSVERDLNTTMSKAAGGWKKWCDKYEKNPKRATKK